MSEINKVDITVLVPRSMLTEDEISRMDFEIATLAADHGAVRDGDETKPVLHVDDLCGEIEMLQLVYYFREWSVAGQFLSKLAHVFEKATVPGNSPSVYRIKVEAEGRLQPRFE